MTYPDPLMLSGLAESIKQATGEKTVLDVLARLQAERKDAKSMIDSPTPAVTRGMAGKAAAGAGLGGLLAGIIGSAMGAGGAESALAGAAGGIQGGIQGMQGLQSEALAQHEADVKNAMNVLESREKLGSRVAMLIQAGQGDVFKGIDPRILGELMFNEPDMLIDVNEQFSKGKDKAWQMRINTAREVLPYLSPAARMPVLQYLAKETGVPVDMTEMGLGINGLKPMESQNLAVRMDEQFVNGLTVYAEAMYKGIPVDVTKLRRREDTPDPGELAMTAARKLADWLKVENAAGRYPDPWANLPQAGLSFDEILAFKEKFDGQSNRPSFEQFQKNMAQTTGLLGMMGMIQGGYAGLTGEQLMAKVMKDQYASIYLANRDQAINDQAAMFANNYEAVQQEHPDWSHDQISKEASKRLGTRLNAGGMGHSGVQPEIRTPVKGPAVTQPPAPRPPRRNAPRKLTRPLTPEEMKQQKVEELQRKNAELRAKNKK